MAYDLEIEKLVAYKHKLEARLERLEAAMYEIIALDHHNHGPESATTKIARNAVLKPAEAERSEYDQFGGHMGW